MGRIPAGRCLLRGNSNGSFSLPTATTIPAAVAISATTVSTSQITLSWTNVAGETGYRVETSSDGSSWSPLTVTNANVVTYASTGLSADSLHYYRVTAFNAAGDGASTVTSRRTLLSAPTGLVASASSSTSVTLTWNDTSGESAYQVERWNGKAWALLTTLSAGVTTYVNTGLAASKSYSYRVRATNAGGDSAPGDVAAALTPASAPLPKKAAAVFQSKKVIGVAA